MRADVLFLNLFDIFGNFRKLICLRHFKLSDAAYSVTTGCGRCLSSSGPAQYL